MWFIRFWGSESRGLLGRAEPAVDGGAGVVEEDALVGPADD